MNRRYLDRFKGKVYPTQVPTLQQEFKKRRYPTKRPKPYVPPPNSTPYYQGHGSTKV